MQNSRRGEPDTPIQAKWVLGYSEGSGIAASDSNAECMSFLSLTSSRLPETRQNSRATPIRGGLRFLRAREIIRIRLGRMLATKRAAFLVLTIGILGTVVADDESTLSKRYRSLMAEYQAAKEVIPRGPRRGGINRHPATSRRPPSET